MNYKKIYENLIKKAKTRKKENNIYERHHIIPKCLGGKNNKENLVYLTPKEHYLAHLLLYKIHKNDKLLKAVLMMTVGRNKSKKYSFLREKYIEIRKKEHQSNNPTKNKRWISNEKETILVDKNIAENFVSSGKYVYGKNKNVFFCDFCEKILLKKCKKCSLNEKYEKIREREKQKVVNIWKKFILSDHDSITSFAKATKTSQPRLTQLFSKYIDDYKKYKKHGKHFKKCI